MSLMAVYFSCRSVSLLLKYFLLFCVSVWHFRVVAVVDVSTRVICLSDMICKSGFSSAVYCLRVFIV